MEDKEVLVSDEKKIVFDAIGFPIASGTAVVLLFNNKLFELKASALKDFHDLKG